MGGGGLGGLISQVIGQLPPNLQSVPGGGPPGGSAYRPGGREYNDVANNIAFGSSAGPAWGQLSAQDYGQRRMFNQSLPFTYPGAPRDPRYAHLPPPSYYQPAPSFGNPEYSLGGGTFMPVRNPYGRRY